MIAKASTYSSVLTVSCTFSSVSALTAGFGFTSDLSAWVWKKLCSRCKVHFPSKVTTCLLSSPDRFSFPTPSALLGGATTSACPRTPYSRKMLLFSFFVNGIWRREEKAKWAADRGGQTIRINARTWATSTRRRNSVDRNFISFKMRLSSLKNSIIGRLYFVALVLNFWKSSGPLTRSTNDGIRSRANVATGNVCSTMTKKTMSVKKSLPYR